MDVNEGAHMGESQDTKSKRLIEQDHIEYSLLSIHRQLTEIRKVIRVAVVLGAATLGAMAYHLWKMAQFTMIG